MLDFNVKENSTFHLLKLKKFDFLIEKSTP